MKKQLFLTIIMSFFVSTIAFSQVYHGILDEDKSITNQLPLQNDNTRINGIESDLNKDLGMVMVFMWYPQNVDVAGCNNLISRGITPLITLEVGKPYTDIIAGTYDSYFNTIADQLKLIKGTVILRYNHEMNGNWYAWDGSHNGANTTAATNYKNAWKRVHGIIKTTKQANNVLWNWCVNGQSYPNETWNEPMDYYPGSSYVDWIGFDSYDKPYSTADGYESVDDIFGAIYATITAGAPDKPVLVGEFASENYGHESDPHKLDFFSQGGNLFSKYPRIHAFSYFNSKKDNSGRWNNYKYNNPTACTAVYRDNWIQNVNVVNGNSGIESVHLYKSIPATGTSLRVEGEKYFDQVGISTQTCSEGGLNIQNSSTGDYMDYLINVPQSGKYTFTFRISTSLTTGKISVKNAAGTILATYSQTASTGGWQNWQSKSVTATLAAGKQKIRIYYSSAGINLNWFEIKYTAAAKFSSEDTKAISSTQEIDSPIINNEFKTYPNPVTDVLNVDLPNTDNNTVEIYAIDGKKVYTKSVNGINTTQVDVSKFSKGMYILKLVGTEEKESKFIVK